MYWKQIDSYSASVRCKTSSGVQSFARILCNKGTQLVGVLNFWPDGVPVPGSQMSTSGYPVCQFTRDQYAAIIDLLRHEDPVFLSFSEDSGTGAITTSKEPVGEAE